MAGVSVMIFLDANAFYSYIGRRNLGLIESTHVNEAKLSKYLDSIREKSLPTSVFIEIMVHFRDDSSRLREILEFRLRKGLPLFNNIPDYCISEDEITCIYFMDDFSLKKYAYKLLDEKIGVESRFAYLFYEITKNLYLEYRLQEIGDFTEKEEKGVWNFLGRKEAREEGNTIIEAFKDVLKTGYEQDKEQNLLKEKYIDKLNEACQIIDVILAGCIACRDEGSDIIEAIQAAYDESVTRGFDGINGTMPGIVTQLQNNTVFLEQAKTKISGMFQKHHYNKFQTEYLRNVMFTAWYDRGQKLKKNDIFDMMCAGCLGYVRPIHPGESVLTNTESYIISFDSTMEKYIDSVSIANTAIIQRFKNA